MKRHFRYHHSPGFAVVEAALIVGVIALVGFVAYTFYQRYNPQPSLAPAANTVTAPSPTSQAPAPSGTTASVDQITEQDAATETTVDNSADTQTEQAATSPDTALNTASGAYNENNL